MGARLAGSAVVFAIVAAYFLYSGYSTPTSVQAEGQTVANLELMHIQTLQFSIGLACALISAVCAVGASIVGAIRPDE